MNRTDFILLSILFSMNATSSISAVSIQDIMDEDLDIKTNTYQKKMLALKNQGYVLAGMKEGKANTYYLSNAGRKLVEENMSEE